MQPTIISTTHNGTSTTISYRYRGRHITVLWIPALQRMKVTFYMRSHTRHVDGIGDISSKLDDVIKQIDIRRMEWLRYAPITEDDTDDAYDRYIDQHLSFSH